METIKTEPKSTANLLFTMGVESMQAGDDGNAEKCFRKAINFNPYFAEAYANLALLLDRKGDIELAEEFYRLSIELNPTYAENHLNLGALLANKKDFKGAEDCYKEAIKIKHDCPITWSNLGVLYACMKREEEAEECYKKAISINNDYAMVKFNLSYLQLRQGRLSEGWANFEARDWYKAISKQLNCPRWKGELLAGKSILICFEAGYGDVIQFCRYCAALKEQGVSTITMIVHPPLKRLLSMVEAIDVVVGFDEEMPVTTWDCWTPLLSIPFYCNTNIDTIPANVPYLYAPEELVNQWKKFIPIKGLNIGLVWKGNPLFENDTDRSLSSLEVLSPINKIKGVNFISLQTGVAENEITSQGKSFNLINIGSQLKDFSDTASVIMGLDLVISVDTAVAHLAGALGKPCWVLLPYYKTDWRWLKARTDSPWYPKYMKLFRQEFMGDWSSVIYSLIVDLEFLSLNSTNI